MLRSGFLNALRAGFLVVGLSTALTGQHGEDQQPTYITITKVTTSKGKKGHDIRVSGKVSKLPSGTKVDFELVWKSQTLETLQMETSGSSFSEEFTVDKVPITPEPFMFKTVIHSEKQSRKIRSKLADDEKSFPKALDPWTEYHRKAEFHLGTKEEIAAEVAYIRSFYDEQLQSLVKVRSAVITETKRAKAGEAYVKKDEFDAKKWRSWFEKEAVAPLKTAQKQIGEAFDAPRFRPYRFATVSLREVANCVAWQIVKRSKDLYKEHGLDADPNDARPEEMGLDVQTRSRNPGSARELNQLVESMQNALPKAPESSDPEKKGDASK